MKKFLILITLILLSIVIFSASAQTQIAGRVTVSRAGVEVLRSGTEDWVAITMESVVGTGDRLRTDANGQSEIGLFDQNALIRLEPNTELSINRMERTEQGFLVAFGLLNGHIHQTLLPVPDLYIGYEFSTPTTTLVTAGGVFDLWLDDAQNTNILTTDGAVYVGENRVQLGALQGMRAEASGALSEIIAAESAVQLSASIDGVPARFITDADVQLNIRQGPDARTELLGTVLPREVNRVMGVSEDGQWYRLKHGRGYGWVSRSAFQVEVEAANLVAYPADHIERLVTEETAPAISAAPTVEAPAAAANNAGAAILQHFSYAEVELIARLNEWRIRDGMWPLKPNTTLRDMAYSQGRYLLSLSRLPDDLHTDAQGRNPRQRALDPAFNWPHYLSADRMAIGENIYIGSNLNAAINYWQNSEIHRQATISGGYREVGVAVMPHPLGNIYVVVFGARPNVLPILLDPASGTLYVSSESYRYAAPGDWLNAVRGVQFIPSALSPVNTSGWTPWARALNRPNGDAFTVAYQGDENKLVMVNFNPAEDIAWLPSNLPSQDGTMAAANTGAPAAPQPTSTPALLDIPQMNTVGGSRPANTTQSSAPASMFATNTPPAP